MHLLLTFCLRFIPTLYIASFLHHVSLTPLVGLLYEEQGPWNGRESVRLSVSMYVASFDRRRGVRRFAAECPAGGWLGSRVVACWTLVEMFNCIVAALLRVARVGALIAGLAESNGSLLPGLWLTSPAGWLPGTGISSGTLRSVVIEYGLPVWIHTGLSRVLEITINLVPADFDVWPSLVEYCSTVLQ